VQESRSCELTLGLTWLCVVVLITQYLYPWLASDSGAVVDGSDWPVTVSQHPRFAKLVPLLSTRDLRVLQRFISDTTLARRGIDVVSSSCCAPRMLPMWSYVAVATEL